MQASQEKNPAKAAILETDSFLVIPDENSRGVSTNNQTLRGGSPEERSTNGLATNTGTTPEHRVSDSTSKSDQSPCKNSEGDDDASNWLSPVNREPIFLASPQETSRTTRSDPSMEDRATSMNSKTQAFSKDLAKDRKDDPRTSHQRSTNLTLKSERFSPDVHTGVELESFARDTLHMDDISRRTAKGNNVSGILQTQLNSSSRERSELGIFKNASSSTSSVHVEEISKHDTGSKDSRYDTSNKEESMPQGSSKTSSRSTQGDSSAIDGRFSSKQVEETSEADSRGKGSRYESSNKEDSMLQEFSKTSSPSGRADPTSKNSCSSVTSDQRVPKALDPESVDKTSKIAEAEVHASLERAIRSMRYEPLEFPPMAATEEGARGGIDARNEVTSSRRRINDPSTATDTVTRIMHAARKEDDEPAGNLAADQSVEKETIEARNEETDSRRDVESAHLSVGLEKEEAPRGWSSLEDLKERSRRTWSRKAPRVRVAEGLSSKKIVKSKEKRTMGSLKSSLKKNFGSVERMLEDRMERIWEENVEKHPWLLPIETWIVDRCKSSGAYSLAQANEDRVLGMETGRKSREEVPKIEAAKGRTLEFKFTAADGEDEEARVESKMVEHTKELDGEDSARLERSNLDRTSLVSRLRKADGVSQRQENADNFNGGNEDRGILDVKEAKPSSYDLLEKLKDNFRGKMEDIHRYFQRTNRLADVNRRLKSQIWSSVVTIVLVEAKNLLPMDIDGLSDPYVKFRLGTEKYKSKVINKTLNPVWLEQFDLHLYEDPYLGQELEVTVWDRDRSHQDDIMGRAVIDLATLERETTHRLWRELEDGSGNIFLLLTISGTTASETISDLAAHEETPQERVHLYQRYAFCNTLQRVRDVGHLTVKVYRAQGLAAADLGGKSDPFCVLELVNARLQTQTEYKTLAPNWQKIFTFNVKDINSVLEVTVYDEDRDHKVEFLGKVAIPLLRIRNGEKRWYALKDKKLRGRAKGNSPQILLEMNVVWNVIRACVRTLNPKEKKYMEPEVKFKRQVFLRNVLRLKAIIVIFIDIGKYIQSCWEWENKMRSIIALILFILGCYYFEPYMIPVAALLILLKYYLVAVLTGAPLTHHTGPHLQDPGDAASDDCPVTPGDDDDDEDDKDKEEKKSLKERLQAIQEVTQTVQNSIGYIASLCEKVKNLFNFTVPYLSCLAMILAVLGVAVLYFIPVRYMILAWGVNKFSRKIVRPHSVPNNEVLDLISRVPDDEELLNYRELKPLPTADCERGGGSGSPGTSNVTRREQRKRHKAA
ncbi:hypothetical protein KM043_017504 [Ampulex compressa]|nr:hypothetical protein KM043_017504 [Ampulex compressa]